MRQRAQKLRLTCLQHFYSDQTCAGLQLLYLQGVQSASAESFRIILPAIEASAGAWKAVAVVERVLAAVLLLPVSPLLVPVALILAILSRRSPLVAHQRVGQGGRTIWVLKLRTMWDSAGGTVTKDVGNAVTVAEKRRAFFIERLTSTRDDRQGPKKTDDPRVTSRFARACRRYSIDELPQLWQVVRGDMTLVAPRPLTRYELETYYGADAETLLARKPGLSGLWQVSGRSRLTYNQRRRLDLFMIRNWSLPLYCRILIITLPRVLAGKDAW